MHICLEGHDHLIGCSFLKVYFTFNSVYVYVCKYVHMSVCAPKEPRGMRSLEAGVVGSCEALMWVLVFKLGFSRTVQIPSPEPSSSPELLP